MYPLRRDHQSRIELLEYLPKNARGVEIGVWKGDFSSDIINITIPSSLTLVDPWQFWPGHEYLVYGGKIAKSQDDMDAVKASVEQRFADDARVRICPQSSTEFFANNTSEFDWIYIDGDHNETTVSHDLNAAWDHIEAGGFICGDDYHWRDRKNGNTFSVMYAVDRFVKQKRCWIKFLDDQFLIRKE